MSKRRATRRTLVMVQDYFSGSGISWYESLLYWCLNKRIWHFRSLQMKTCRLCTFLKLIWSNICLFNYIKTSVKLCVIIFIKL
jgi:hypothetical protein